MANRDSTRVNALTICRLRLVTMVGLLVPMMRLVVVMMRFLVVLMRLLFATMALLMLSLALILMMGVMPIVFIVVGREMCRVSRLVVVTLGDLVGTVFMALPGLMVTVISGICFINQHSGGCKSQHCGCSKT